MKKFFLAAALFVSQIAHAQVDELVKENTQFAFSFYSQVNRPANFVFSPYSIYSGLSMVYTGAREETASEMQKTLFLTFTQNKTASLWSALRRTLTLKPGDADAYQLTSANSLWLEQDTYILTDYRHLMENEYAANIENLDFEKTDDATAIINKWVSNETKGKIPQLLLKGDLTRDTRLVLVNALYFQGKWTKPFEVSNTAPAPFHPTTTTSMSVPMMTQTGSFSYFENDMFQLLSLPFVGRSPKNSQLACLILLPKEDIAVFDVEQTLAAADFQTWIKSLSSRTVNIKLPRFELKMRLDLGQTLQDMGMKLAFTSKANFSGIDGMRDLFLSKVVHETYFALDEAGVTAASATASGMSTTSMPEKNPAIFNADHPFLFFIVDLNTKTPLFMGKFHEPNVSS